MLLSNMIRGTLRSLGLLFGSFSRFVRRVSVVKRSVLTAFQASVQDINQYALVIEGAETVANIVTRYRIVERLYLVKQHEITNQLEEHITDLYALVLKFLVKAKKFYLRNTTSKCKGHWRLVPSLLNGTDLNYSQSPQEYDRLQQ